MSMCFYLLPICNPKRQESGRSKKGFFSSEREMSPIGIMNMRSGRVVRFQWKEILLGSTE